MKGLACRRAGLVALRGSQTGPGPLIPEMCTKSFLYALCNALVDTFDKIY